MGGNRIKDSICRRNSIQGRRKVWKSGGANCNVVGIICPLVQIGLTDLPKSGSAPTGLQIMHYTIHTCLTLTFPLTKRKQLTVSTYCYIWQFINKIGTSNNIYHIMKMAYLCDMYVSSLCNLHNGLKPFSKVAFLHSYSCIFMKNINAQLIIC